MANPVPTSIDVDKSKGLRLTWPGGVVTNYTLELLRSMCPCAKCKEERAEKKAKKPVLMVLPGNYAGDILIDSVELIGNYAIKIAWTDGHDTGIYSFVFLRELANA